MPKGQEIWQKTTDISTRSVNQWWKKFIILPSSLSSSVIYIIPLAARTVSLSPRAGGALPHRTSLTFRASSLLRASRQQIYFRWHVNSPIAGKTTDLPCPSSQCGFLQSFKMNSEEIGDVIDSHMRVFAQANARGVRSQRTTKTLFSGIWHPWGPMDWSHHPTCKVPFYKTTHLFSQMGPRHIKNI